jgi:hypothetical protein
MLSVGNGRRTWEDQRLSRNLKDLAATALHEGSEPTDEKASNPGRIGRESAGESNWESFPTRTNKQNLFNRLRALDVYPLNKVAGLDAFDRCPKRTAGGLSRHSKSLERNQKTRGSLFSIVKDLS